MAMFYTEFFSDGLFAMGAAILFAAAMAAKQIFPQGVWALPFIGVLCVLF